MLHPSNLAGHIIHAGRNPIAKPVVIAGHVENIQTVDTPVLLWDAKTNYTFPSSAVSLELVSSSASDAAAGTGAQLISIDTIDANGGELNQLVTPNGTTAVALTGTHLAINFATVIQSGSNNVNVGNITIRVSGGGATHGYILAGIGAQRALRYTVPTGKTFVIDNFYVNPLDTLGVDKFITLDFNLRFSNGTVIQTQRNYFKNSGVTNLTLPTGFGIPADSTIYGVISNITANGVSFAFSMSGGLYSVRT